MALSSVRRDGVIFWECACDCGARKVIAGGHLRGRKTVSCGCINPAATAASNRLRKTRHGHAPQSGCSRTYYAYQSMKQRCYNAAKAPYPYYGGRGIEVCARWLESFDNFLADMGEAPTGRSLDRINNDGDYEPGNCRWATPYQQTHNRRRSAGNRESAEAVVAGGRAVGP